MQAEAAFMGGRDKQQLSVSAIVVNFNGGDRILKCLDAMERQTVPLEEIIVVDNQSTDDSLDRIRDGFPRARILELGENRGLPAARNVGLHAATTELVLLNTYDVYMAEDSLSRLLQACGQDRPAVVAPRVVLFPKEDIVHCDGAAVHFVGTLLLRHGYQPLKDTPAETAVVDACMGACFLADRGRLLAAGGFDEHYFHYLEDLEISIRMRVLGHELICEPAAVVYHDLREGTPGVAFRGHGEYPPHRAFLMLSGRLRTVLIYYRVRTLLLLSPALALFEIVCLCAVVSRGCGIEWLRAWGWQVKNAHDIRKRRRWVQSRRTRSDKELLVDGPIPLAPGFVRSRAAAAAVAALSKGISAYWRLVRRWVG